MRPLHRSAPLGTNGKSAASYASWCRTTADGTTCLKQAESTSACTASTSRPTSPMRAAVASPAWPARLTEARSPGGTLATAATPPVSTSRLARPPRPHRRRRRPLRHHPRPLHRRRRLHLRPAAVSETLTSPLPTEVRGPHTRMALSYPPPKAAGLGLLLAYRPDCGLGGARVPPQESLAFCSPPLTAKTEKWPPGGPAFRLASHGI